MPSPSSQRQLIIDQIIHRLQSYANATVTDSIFKHMNSDGTLLAENLIYVVAGQEDGAQEEYGTTRLRTMTVLISIIVGKADNPEREFEAMLKQVRDILERDPELKTTASNATTALCLMLTERSLTQPEYNEMIYSGNLIFNCKYQYTSSNA